MKGSALLTSLLVASLLAPAGSADAAPVTPTLTAALSGSAVLGDPITDTVTLSGGAAPTGQLSVSVYGPGDPTCSGFPELSSFVAISDNGQHAFPTHPDDVGTFRYVASYSGDADNDPVSTGCGDPDQTVTITPAHSSLATTASPSVAVGGQLTDTARLSHVVTPGGTVTFSLFGPGDEQCAGPPLATSTVAPQTTGSDDTRATSPPYVATAPGTYRWIASYSGDARNLPVAGACGDAGESVLVTPAPSPIGSSLRIRASGGASVGEPIRATATLATAGVPMGELTFRFYRPGDAACRRGAVAASTRDVLGNGDYTSDPFTPDEAGTYRIVAVYHGADATTTLATDCDDPAAAVSVAATRRLRPTLEKEVTVRHVEGRVLLQVPASAARRPTALASAIGFVQLFGSRNVPVGSTVDVDAGTARITGATKRRARFQSGEFRGASFVVQQRAASGDRVELRLRRGDAAPGACDRGARSARRRPLRRRIAAKLHAKVRGDFRTHGEHSSAEAHSSSVSTSWTISERCEGTLTQVHANVVAVRDYRLHRTFLVRAGHSYLARGAGPR